VKKLPFFMICDEDGNRKFEISGTRGVAMKIRNELESLLSIN
jgi:hypothetical protein